MRAKVSICLCCPCHKGSFEWPVGPLYHSVSFGVMEGGVM